MMKEYYMYQKFPTENRPPTEPKRSKRPAKRSKKKRFGNAIMISAIIAVCGYTAAAIVLQFIVQMEISDVLTYCWFGFWTCEIFALAGIKKAKVKNPLYEQAGNSYGGYGGYSGITTNDFMEENITETEDCGNG